MDKSLRKFISYFTTGEKIALITAFLCGLVTHMYMFTNKIPNHDDMRYSFSYSNLVQDVYTSNSRWGLPFLSQLSGFWSTPWLIGILSILFLSLTAMLVVRMLKIQGIVTAALTGCLLVTFPTVTAIFEYMVTADTYFLALLLCTLASFILTKNNVFCFIFSVLCFTLSLSIYQPFLPFALSLFCAYLIRVLIEKRDNRLVIISFAKLAVASALGLALYLIVAKLLGAMGDRVNSQKLGGIREIVGRGVQGLQSLFGFFFQDSLNLTSSYFCVAFCILSVLSAVLFVISVKRRRMSLSNKICLTFFVIAFLGSLISVYIIISETIHLLMIYAFVMLPISYVAVFDVWVKRFNIKTIKITSAAAVCLTALLCWNFMITANHNYLRMDLTVKQTYAFSNRLIQRIEDTPGYTTDMPVVFIGAPTMNQDNSELYSVLWGSESIQLTGSLSPNDLLAYSASAYFPYQLFLSQYLGWNHTIYRVYEPYCDSVEGADLVAENLTVYPQAGSTCVADGMIFVRFQ